MLQGLCKSAFYKLAAPSFKRDTDFIAAAAFELKGGRAPFQAAAMSWSETGPTDGSTQSFRSAAMTAFAQLARATDAESGNELRGKEAVTLMIKNLYAKEQAEGPGSIVLEDLRPIQFWRYLIDPNDQRKLAAMVEKATQQAMVILRAPGEAPDAGVLAMLPPLQLPPKKKSGSKRKLVSLGGADAIAKDPTSKVRRMMSVEDALMASIKA